MTSGAICGKHDVKLFNLGAPSKNVEDKRGFQGDAANVMFSKFKGRVAKIDDYTKGGKPLPGPMPPNMAAPERVSPLQWVWRKLGKIGE